MTHLSVVNRPKLLTLKNSPFFGWPKNWHHHFCTP